MQIKAYRGISCETEGSLSHDLSHSKSPAKNPETKKAVRTGEVQTAHRTERWMNV